MATSPHAFLAQTSGLDRAHSQRLGVTVMLAFVAHAMVISGLALHELVRVEELRPPTPKYALLQPINPTLIKGDGPRMGDEAAGAAGSPPAVTPNRRHRRTNDKETTPAAVTPATDTTTPAPAGTTTDGPAEGPGGDTGTGAAAGPGTGTGGGDCTWAEGHPCAAEGRPTLVPPVVGARQCQSCPTPHLPAGFLAVAGQVRVLTRICVGKTGVVDRVDILQGVSPGIDQTVRETLAGWRLRPMTIDENPVPFCYMAAFNFRSVR